MNPAWQRQDRNGLSWFELSPGPGPRIAFLTRRGGVSRAPFTGLNLSCDVGDDPEAVGRNLGLVRETLEFPRIALLNQVHGSRVVRVPGPEAETPDADAQFTTDTGTALGVRVADCLPVWVWDRNATVAGIAHCGWRGTVERTALKLVEAIRREAGTALLDLFFALGPCICPACYPVREETVDRIRDGLPEADRFLQQRPDGWHFAIREANRALLTDAGLTESGSLDECTRERADLFFSARRDRTTGRNLALIRLEPTAD